MPDILAAVGLHAGGEWRTGEVRAGALGYGQVRARRVDDVIAPAFEIVHAIDTQLTLHAALHAAGAAHGLADIGRRAHDALRVEAGIGRWGVDFAADRTPEEAGLASLLASGKSAPPVTPKSGAFAPKSGTLVRLAIAPNGAEIDPWGHEPVYVGERQVGVVTSGSFAPTLSGSIALAFLDGNEAGTGDLEVEILGVRRKARVVARA